MGMPSYTREHRKYVAAWLKLVAEDAKLRKRKKKKLRNKAKRIKKVNDDALEYYKAITEVE